MSDQWGMEWIWRQSEHACVYVAGEQERNRWDRHTNTHTNVWLFIFVKKKLQCSSLFVVVFNHKLFFLLTPFWIFQSWQHLTTFRRPFQSFHFSSVLQLFIMSWMVMWAYCREVWHILTWVNLLVISLWSSSVARSMMRWCIWVTGFFRHEVIVMSHTRVALVSQIVSDI